MTEGENSEAAPKGESATAGGEASGSNASKTAIGGKAAGSGRGERQKPVSRAYRDNWNAIFENETAKKKR